MREFTRVSALTALALTAVAAVGSGAAAAEATGPATVPAAQVAAVDQPARAVDPTIEYLNALAAVNTAFAVDSSLGRVIGATAGFVIGCPLGALTGGTLTLPMPVLTPIGVIGGCVIGAGTLGFLGGTAGAVLSGSPSMLAELDRQYNSLRSKNLIAQELPATSGEQG
ncbi:hypothetical protein AB0H76_11765 [Nocardia sp. NPDC050712]|uniref:hypothetical protein n=1 Tax=Nocardia sp. NPDC050712 TaxID=3155518 RepID=UPI0033ED3172